MCLQCHASTFDQNLMVQDVTSHDQVLSLLFFIHEKNIDIRQEAFISFINAYEVGNSNVFVPINLRNLNTMDLKYMYYYASNNLILPQSHIICREANVDF